MLLLPWYDYFLKDDLSDVKYLQFAVPFDYASLEPTSVRLLQGPLISVTVKTKANLQYFQLPPLCQYIIRIINTYITTRLQLGPLTIYR